MDAEQTTQQDSEVSIESRLAAHFAEPQPEQPEAAAEAPADMPDDEVTDESAEPTPEETIDFEADDGKVIKIPAAAKDALLRHSDYTKKTQALSNLQAQATDRLQYAEAREQLAAAVIQEVVDLKTMQGEYQKYQSADWASLYAADPGRALMYQQQMRDIEKQIAEKQGAIQAKATHIQKATADHAKFQWDKAEQGAREMLGSITQQDNIAMAQTIRNLGLSEQEFKTRFADPRIIAAVYKAAKWEALQESKPKAIETAKWAPPVVKPGAVNHMSAEVKQDLAFRKAMKATNSSQTRARLIEQRLADRFK